MSLNWCKATVHLSVENESFHVKCDKLSTLARFMEDVEELSSNCCCFQRLKWFPRYFRHQPQKSKLVKTQFSFLFLLMLLSFFRRNKQSATLSPIVLLEQV